MSSGILFLCRPTCFEQTTKPNGSIMKDSINMNDFQTVTRFENLGGGWGYSGQSVEAIRFMADTDVVLSKHLSSLLKHHFPSNFHFILRLFF